MNKIIKNGKIYIERGNFAESAYISNGLIVRTGTNDEILASAPAGCEVIDAGDRTVLPGFNDSHMHLASVGEWLSLLDLSGARAIDEIIARAKKYMADRPDTARNGIKGVGWNQDLFEGPKRLLNRNDLDRISRDIPIVFKRVCGHIAAANTKAIEISGLTASSPQIEGGVFEISDGELNGVFKETAVSLIEAIIPPHNPAEWKSFLKAAADYCLSVGLTSVQSNDAREEISWDMFRILKEMNAEGELRLRYRHQITFSEESGLLEFLRTERRDPAYGGGRLTLGPLKLFKDGSLGARTALRRDDYRDDPGNRGVDCLPADHMDRLLRIAADNGMQVMTHAIGDGALEQTLDAYAKVIAGRNELRHAVNHCQITDLPLLRRIAKMGVLVMAQPIFLNTDLHIVEDRVGKETASTSYAFGTLRQLGAHVSYGTDSPVEDSNPFKCVYSAVTRKDLTGNPPGGFSPGERVDVPDAVDAYTAESAYAEFRESEKGRLKPGYYADLVMLDRDIFTIPHDGIKDVKADLTMVGGEVVFGSAG
jgi:predicted amidohydrolase YtcJ